jgi:hypothetical protein
LLDGGERGEIEPAVDLERSAGGEAEYEQVCLEFADVRPVARPEREVAICGAAAIEKPDWLPVDFEQRAASADDRTTGRQPGDDACGPCVGDREVALVSEGARDLLALDDVGADDTGGCGGHASGAGGAAAAENHC